MAASTMAVPVATSTFGPFPGANFGGSGNPTDPVAVTTITDGANVITLGLAAQQRYNNPALGNNGAGVFYATPGYNNGLRPSGSSGATWNFDYYFDINGPDAQNYSVLLFMESSANSPGSSIAPALVGDNKTTPSSLAAGNPWFGGQNSENLSFAGFGNLTSFQINPWVFDPNATDDYKFTLVAYDARGNSIGNSSITVSVAPVPDAGSTSLLLGSALAGLALVRRKIAA
jgi:hypothetical protein